MWGEGLRPWAPILSATGLLEDRIEERGSTLVRVLATGEQTFVLFVVTYSPGASAGDRVFAGDFCVVVPYVDDGHMEYETWFEVSPGSPDALSHRIRKVWPMTQDSGTRLRRLGAVADLRQLGSRARRPQQ